jgi:hypothetical protein
MRRYTTGVLTFHCGEGTISVGSISAVLSHVTVTDGGETFTVQHAELDAELVRVSIRNGGGASAVGTAVAVGGRGVHSYTFQLNLSRFCHKLHPEHPRILLHTP